MIRRIAFLVSLIISLVFPITALADSTLTISPTSWDSADEIFTWTIGGTPNGGDYGECFNPDGSHLSRFGGGLPSSFPGGPIPGNDPLDGPTSYYIDTLQHACDNQIPNGTGTLHFVGVNVDSGTGFFGWLNNCDANSATYSGCTDYLLGNNRAGYFDIALPYSGATTPPPCTQNCYSNVLFIPGMESSRLYMKNPDATERQVWEPGALSMQSDAQALYLRTDGSSINQIYTKADGAIDTTLGGDIYKTFLVQLATLKTNGTYNDYAIFPYDWRMSPSDVVTKGTAYADGTHYLKPLVESLAANSKTRKVTIIAHSNGGLVTKALMQQLSADGKANLVDKIIFVDVPQVGTPKAVAAMLHGDGESIGWPFYPGAVISQANARALGENMPDGFSLLPSAAYFAAVATPVADFVKAPQLLSTAGISGSAITSASDLRAFTTGAGGRAKPPYADVETPDVLSSALFDAAAAEHAQLNAWTPPAGVSVVQIAGWGLDTPSGIAYTEKKTPFCLIGLACSFVTTLQHKVNQTVDGDATVVVPSEVQSVWPAYYVDLGRYDHDMHTNLEHENITEAAPFQNLFQSLVASAAAPPLPPYVTTTLPSAAGTRLRLRVLSPVSLDAYDSAGRHTGIAPNPNPASDLQYVEDQIPSSYYQQYGEGKYIGLYGDDTYVIKLKGQDTGTFTFEITPVAGDTEGQPVTFADVPVTASSSATITIIPSSIASTTLALDINGDGTTITTLPGAMANEDPIGYVRMMLASVDAEGLGKNVKKQLHAKIANLMHLLTKDNEWDTGDDDTKEARADQNANQQIAHKIEKIESYVQQQIAKKKQGKDDVISTDQAAQLIDMLEHLKELTGN